MLEEFYALNQRMNLSISECRKLPLPIRKWYINKLIKTANAQNKAIESRSKTKKTSNSNSSENIDISKVNKFFAKFEK